MYRIFLHSKTSNYLITQGVPEYIEIIVGAESDKSKAIHTARMMNEHIRKFHSERIGREYYYVKEI